MSRADKRARRIAEHLEWLRAQGRTEVEDLGESTTGTTFLYSGDQRPTETMQMVSEVASDRDRQWFEDHPEADYRVRRSLPGEFPTDDPTPSSPRRRRRRPPTRERSGRCTTSFSTIRTRLAPTT